MRPDVIWMQDSYGKSTLHVNAPGLNFNESLRGELRFDRDEGLWYYRLVDGTVDGPFTSAGRAARELEQTVLSKEKRK